MRGILIERAEVVAETHFLAAEMANQGYRKGYDQAMEKSHQLEDRLQKRSAELEQLLGECIRHQYIDEARASHSWLIAAKKAVGSRC